MKTKIFTLLAAIFLVTSYTYAIVPGDPAISTSSIVTHIDLSAVVDDKVPVTVNPDRFTSEKATYRLPKVVQGTYAVGDFGRYIDDFKAVDYKGNELTVNKTDTNSWEISNAAELDYITYYVNDTFDEEVVGGIGGEVYRLFRFA